MTALTPELLKKLPKVDLHLHLDGAARPKTLMELAKKAGARLPTQDPEEFKVYVQVSRNCRSLTDFLKAFEFFYPYLKSAEAVERLAYELCEDCAAHNVRVFEARFAPALQATDKFSMEDVVRAAIRGIERGQKDFSVKAGFHLCCYRSLSETENDETVRLAEKYLGKGVVGIDLAGDESRYPVTMYAAFFKKAVQKKIPITCHAGEAAGPESIKNALALGASRIGHGIRVIDDPELLKRVEDEHIPFEVCITSNVHTQTVKGFSVHPAKKMLDEGVDVTLNTDDPGVSGIDLTHEFVTAVDTLGFTAADCRDVIINGVRALFLPESEKKKIEQDYTKQLQNLLGEGK
ncbi:MAG TPA: adenosine deaminase [Elusimicrobiota bacterium]|nr:adenosine deaminase [Elusimicrobiota bacterium]